MRDSSLFHPVHVGIWGHPKLARLARMMDVPIEHAFGCLSRLISFAVVHRQEGDLHRMGLVDIGVAAGWESDEDALRFARALVACGWIDEVPEDEREGATYRMHEWADYAGRGLQARAKEAQRARRRRAAHRGAPTPMLDEDDVDDDVEAHPAPAPAPAQPMREQREQERRRDERRGAIGTGVLGLNAQLLEPASPAAVLDVVRDGKTLREIWTERYAAFDGKGDRPTLLDVVARCFTHAQARRAHDVKWLWPHAIGSYETWLMRDHEQAKRSLALDERRARPASSGFLPSGSREAMLAAAAAEPQADRERALDFAIWRKHKEREEALGRAWPRFDVWRQQGKPAPDDPAPEPDDDDDEHDDDGWNR